MASTTAGPGASTGPTAEHVAAGGGLPSVAQALTTLGWPGLHRVGIPPSRNGFYTDRAKVFIKENTAPLDHEHVAASHAWRHGIPTPSRWPRPWRPSATTAPWSIWLLTGTTHLLRYR